MHFFSFLRENARWVGGAFVMNYFTAFGQTYFISLSAGEIRAEYNLSHGDFGLLYMGATLLSALTLARFGRIVDYKSVVYLVLIVMPLLALATVIMALSHWIVLLFLSLYMLRLFGQGMMSHIAVTAMGRWFNARRGRAVSLSSLGFQVGEASFPGVLQAKRLFFLFVLASRIHSQTNTPRRDYGPEPPPRFFLVISLFLLNFPTLKT